MKLFYKSMIFLLIVGISLMAFGQAPTAAGTNIVNVATATFTDSNGTNRNSQSNPVTTVVQAVYNFNVEPDNNNDPGPAGGAGAAANSGDNDFSLDPDPSNNKTANAGDTVILEYNIENLSNTAIDVGLTMASDPANTLSPSSVELYVDDDPTTADGADTNGDGIPDNYVLYNPAAKPNIPRNDGTSGSGDDFLKVFAKIVLPANALGNEVAKFDLQATNDTAVADGKTGDNISYENNNIGRIEINEHPSIGAAKAITDTRNLHDGTYEVDYTVTLENFGNVDLSYVQATEDLATTFGAATAWSVKAGTLASADFTVDAAFDGNANNKLLTVAAGNALAVGASGTITFTVVVEPGASLGSYDNSVTAQGTSPDDEAAPGFDNTNPTASTTDNSVDGLDPDHDATDDTTDGSTDDDGTPNEQSPTQITFTENPVLGVAKSATASVDAVGFPGQFETDITFTVENLGDVELRNLQVTDDLDTTFAAPVTYSVVSITSANLTENASFNGSADQNLLTGVDTLAVGQTETIVIKVRYDPNGETGPFNNQARGTAISPGSPLGGGGNPTVNVTDDSTDGTNPDPNDNDNPDENTPTPISFTENPVVGVAKAATVVDADTDNDPTTVGPYDVRLDFVITNYGNVNISNLALTDDLTAVGNFGAGNYTVTSAPSFRVAPPATSTINLNAGYNGDADIALVAAGSNLDVGDSATISITVHLTTPGAYKNEADVAGQSPAGVVVTDDSTNGANPDPNSDGNPSSGDPGNPNEDEPTPINLDALQLVKSHRVCADADCTTVVDATGATVEPGQYIEYTIVASNVGGQGLTDVVIFDEIPTWLLPVAGSANYAASANTSATIECSTNNGGSWAACPAGISTTVTNVRLSVGNLAAAANETLTFVVYIP